MLGRGLCAFAAFAASTPASGLRIEADQSVGPPVPDLPDDVEGLMNKHPYASFKQVKEWNQALRQRTAEKKFKYDEEDKLPFLWQYQMNEALQKDPDVDSDELEKRVTSAKKAAQRFQKARTQATKPIYRKYAKRARWLVYQSDYAVAGTVCSDGDRDGCLTEGSPFSNIMAISDGDDTTSTGVVYVYISLVDPSPVDLAQDSYITMTLTEEALAPGNACTYTAENPTCTRLTLTGSMAPAQGQDITVGKAYLFARHPEMANWPDDHSFAVYVLTIDSIFFLDMYGASPPVTVDDYYAADPLDSEEQHVVIKENELIDSRSSSPWSKLKAGQMDWPAVMSDKPKSKDERLRSDGIEFNAKEPKWTNYAARFRWLVYISDYAVVETKTSTIGSGRTEPGKPFGNIMSVSDGDTTISTGYIFVYIPTVDPSTQDLAQDPTVTLTFSQWALGTCTQSAEEPPCTRTTLGGYMGKVDPDVYSTLYQAGQQFLFTKHPEMETLWPSSGFDIYMMVVQTIFGLDMYGPAHEVTPQEYYDAAVDILQPTVGETGKEQHSKLKLKEKFLSLKNRRLEYFPEFDAKESPKAYVTREMGYLDKALSN